MMENNTDNKFYKTLCCIKREMFNISYTGTMAQIKLAKKTKEYLLSVLNFQYNNGKLYDPIFGCSRSTFHGHRLSWDKSSWLKSATMVYMYFKAATLVKAIKSYEKVFKETIVSDYSQVLNSLYNSIANDEEIDYSKVPGLTATFRYVPEEVLNHKLIRFKELYE